METKVPNSIAKLRKEMGLSQDTLAGRLGISVTQLSRLERGLSSLTQARMNQLAEVFAVEPHDLYRNATSKERLELNVMRDVIVQLDEMISRLDVSLTPQQRGDLTVELYRLEVDGLTDEALTDHVVNLKRFEGMVRALGS
ncbi:helix-turn-helix domain-containing protein [Leisingera sp. S232]|uniref:helix-turn-helix domain-containing protein n=1 Tax=Leisingera sp. S232 TaxID=3415132 RepID=UPI003C7DC1FF